MPARVAPMLATLVDAPFHRPGWVWEEKYDGIRLIALKDGRRLRLLTRNDKDRTADFPEVAAALAALPAPTLVLDGEVVVFDAAGVSRFQLLQQRAERRLAAHLRRLRLPARPRPRPHRRAARIPARAARGARSARARGCVWPGGWPTTASPRSPRRAGAGWRG